MTLAVELTYARPLQAFLRGRSNAAATKAQFRQAYDDMLATRSTEPQALVQATRLLVLSFGEHNPADLKRVALWCRAVLATASGSSGELSRLRVPPTELTRLVPRQDAAAVLTLQRVCRKLERLDPSNEPDLVLASYQPTIVSWQASHFRSGSSLISRDSISQAPLFLEIVKILCDPNSFVKWKVASRQGPLPIEYLLDRDFYARLRKLLLSVVSRVVR